MRVLIIKTSSLGDVIHTLPALTDAAHAIPGIRFDWVVEEGFAEIPSWHPAVDQVIPVAIRRWRKNLWQTIKSGEWKAFKQRVRERKYDLVIDAQGLVKSAWLTRYVKAPVAGLDRYSAREGWASRFYDRRLSVATGQHAVERVRQLFAMALAYDLPEGIGNYGLDLERLQLPPAALCGVPAWHHLGDQALARSLLARTGRAHGPAQAGGAPAVGQPGREGAGRAHRPGLEQLPGAPQIEPCRRRTRVGGGKACVAVDTGLGHLAAALDVPTISLFGPTNPGLTGAYGRTQIHQASDWPCAPCLQKKCTYKPSADDLRRFDLKREWPLCFTRLNPEHVASRLSALLLAEDVR